MLVRDRTGVNTHGLTSREARASRYVRKCFYEQGWLEDMELCLRELQRHSRVNARARAADAAADYSRRVRDRQIATIPPQ
jgi:hypothetical protein